jgi:hypothetical protein
MIPFSKPYLTGKETYYIEQAVKKSFILVNKIAYFQQTTIFVSDKIMQFTSIYEFN